MTLSPKPERRHKTCSTPQAAVKELLVQAATALANERLLEDFTGAVVFT